MKPPKCMCGKAHWTYEEHDTGPEEVRELGASVLRKSAINGEERLTDAINRLDEERDAPTGDKPAGVHPVPVVRKSVPDAQASPLLPARPRTPNRRSREVYNAYMKDYMRAYRERSK